jgi:hypothetical protein
MADTDSRPTDAATSNTRLESVDPQRSGTALAAWLVVSAGFLAYLAFGSVEARIWNFGRLLFQDREITHVWAYFGNRLPELPASAVTPVLYYLSLFVMVAGTLLGLWYFILDREDHQAIRSTTDMRADIPSNPKQKHD